jgi:hypothetical protein
MVEQKWTYRGLSGCVVDAAGRQLTADDLSDEVLRVIAAAPDVARELRHLVRLMEPLEREGGLGIPGLATLNGARAALKKAGVL